MKRVNSKKRNHLEVSDKQICEALTKSCGVFSVAAQMLEKSPAWMTKRKKDSLEIQEHCEWLVEQRIDRAEQALDSLIASKNTTAVLFFLKTIGRKRGYVEHAPAESVDSEKLKVLSDFFSSIGAGYSRQPVAIASDRDDLDSSGEKISDRATNFR